MVKRYDTGNLVPSGDPRDFSDNSLDIDTFVNGNENCVETRIGKKILTLLGIDRKAREAIDGFEDLINDKVLAAGGVEIADSFGDSLTKVINQKLLTDTILGRCYTIDDFGASPLKSPDENTKAIQDGIDFVNSSVYRGKAYLRIPPAHYRINGGTLTIPSHAVQFTMEGTGKYASVLNVVDIVNAPTFNDTGYMSSYLSFSIAGKETNRDFTNNIAVLCKRPLGSLADIDANFLNMRINRHHTDIKVVGRGLTVEGCTLSVSVNPIVLDFPNIGDYQEGDQPVQSDKTGFRSFNFIRNRFHSNSGSSILNAGNNSKKIQGILISNNMADIGRVLFEGVLRRSISSNNGVDQTPSPAYILTDGSADYRVEGDIVSGNLDSERIPDNFILIQGTHNNGFIGSMNLSNSRLHGIRVEGSGSRGLVFENVLFKNAGMQSGNFSPITVLGDNNEIYVDEISVDNDFVSTAGIIRNSGIDNRIRLGDVDFNPKGIPRWVGNGGLDSYRKYLNISGKDTLNFTRDGVVRHSIGESIAGTGGMCLYSFGSINLEPLNGAVRPFQDDFVNLGNSVFNFKNIFLTNQPTVTSDSRRKRDIKDIDTRYLEVVELLEFKSYKMNGDDIHFGVIAQDWIEACDRCGVDPYESSILVGSENDGYAIRYGELQNLFNAYILEKLKML